MRGVIKNVVRSKVKNHTSLDDQKHKCMQWSQFQSNYILYKLKDFFEKTKNDKFLPVEVQ